MLEPLFNKNIILSSFIQYNLGLVINLSSPSKGKSPKPEFRGLLLYILISNVYPIQLTFKLSTILLVRKSIGSLKNKLCSYSIGNSPEL